MFAVILLLTCSGLLIGWALKTIAPEEQDPLSTALVNTQIITALLVAVAPLFFQAANMSFFVPLAIAVIVVRPSSITQLILLGAIFGLSAAYQTMLLILTALLLVHLAAKAALSKEHFFSLLSTHLVFLVVALLTSLL